MKVDDKTLDAMVGLLYWRGRISGLDAKDLQAALNLLPDAPDAAQIRAERDRLRTALRNHILTYEVDDDTPDREAAADRIMERLLSKEPT